MKGQCRTRLGFGRKHHAQLSVIMCRMFFHGRHVLLINCAMGCANNARALNTSHVVFHMFNMFNSAPTGHIIHWNIFFVNGNIRITCLHEHRGGYIVHLVDSYGARITQHAACTNICGTSRCERCSNYSCTFANECAHCAALSVVA